MSGIIGVWNLDGRPVERALLARLSATLAHRGPDGEGLWLEGPVGLACQLLRVTPEAATETQPLVHGSGAVVVFDGRLDNREELLALLKGAPGISADSPDPALVLAAYEAFGEKFPERLNGDFALGLFDPHRQQLLLARDALGVRPVYYCRTGETFLFASEIKALLAHPEVSVRANDDALADFLLHNQTQDRLGLGETCFEGVYSIPPAHMALLTPNEFATRRYWDFDTTRRIRLGSFPEYAQAFRHYFEQAVRRRLRSAYPVATSVSGGLDSSAIFCLAETLRRSNPERYPVNFGISYTCGDWAEADESAFLAEIERSYGVEIERFPLIPMGFFDGARDEVWQIEYPLVDEIGASIQALLRTARQHGARVLLTGHWGDQVLFPQGYLIDLFRHLAWGAVKSHLAEYSRWLTDVDPKFYKRRFFRDLVLYHVPDIFRPSLRKLRTLVSRSRRRHPWYTGDFQYRVLRRPSNGSVSNRRFRTVHGRSLYGEATSRYYVQCMEWNNKLASLHGLEIAFPFLDKDMISFLMAIPGDIQTWKGVPKAILREALLGVLPEAISERRWKADFTRVANQGMSLDYNHVLRCFQSDGLAIRSGYLNGDVLRKELSRLRDRIQAPTCEITWSLAELLGLELWLQVFFNEKSGGKGGSETWEPKTVMSAGMR